MSSLRYQPGVQVLEDDGEFTKEWAKKWNYFYFPDLPSDAFATHHSANHDNRSMNQSTHRNADLT